MKERAKKNVAWWARGLLFENCCCTVVCPGHVHFDQNCTFERCVGYWAIRIDEGEYDGVALAGLSAVVAYDAPQRMIEGGWTEAIIIERNATPQQRQAVEAILNGRAGGPWQVLDRFVSRRLETRYLPIRIEDEERKKRVVIDGLLDSTVEAIRGRDRSKTATFENMYNQIHASTMVIARGAARYDDGVIVVNNRDSHGLWSSFDWAVSEGSSR